MKRRVIAAAWIVGATVPLLMATVFLVGCCALPFHNVVHKLMPVCEMAMSVLRGDTAADDREGDATPAQEKQRIATVMPNVVRLAAAHVPERKIAMATPAGYRSFITLGAVRCDRDVGWHVLVATFLI